MKNLKNKLIAFLLIQIFVLTNILSAQALFQLKNHSKTASGWGMGAAISSLNNNIDGIFINPSLLANSQNFYHANFSNFVLGINSTSLSFANDYKYFKYAVNISYMNFGNFKERDIDGNDLGYFSANDKEFSIVIAKKLGKYISAGFTTSYLHSKIDSYNSSNTNFGFGLQYFLSEMNLSVALSFNNFDKMITNYSGANEQIPNLTTLGVSKKLQYLPATVSVDFLKYANMNPIINGGVKFTPNKNFRIFIGTSSRKIELQNQSDIKSLISGVSAGFGVEINSYNFDISYSSLGDAGEITSFSFYRILE